MTATTLKRETIKAKYWRTIAENVEANKGAFKEGHSVFVGLCSAVRWTVPDRYTLLRDEMQREIRLFNNGYLWYWPTDRELWGDSEIKRSDRILAAWLLYWMARGE